MTSNHTPPSDSSIITRHANSRSRLRWLKHHPDYAVDRFTAAMVEVAATLRKAKRADKWERRSA